MAEKMNSSPCQVPAAATWPRPMTQRRPGAAAPGDIAIAGQHRRTRKALSFVTLSSSGARDYIPAAVTDGARALGPSSAQSQKARYPAGTLGDIQVKLLLAGSTDDRNRR